MPKSAFAGLAVALFTAWPASAHHSDAMFDSGKEVVLNGTVKEFQYTNPHSWIQLLVPAAAGAPCRVEYRDRRANRVASRGHQANFAAAGRQGFLALPPPEERWSRRQPYRGEEGRRLEAEPQRAISLLIFRGSANMTSKDSSQPARRRRRTACRRRRDVSIPPRGFCRVCRR